MNLLNTPLLIALLGLLLMPLYSAQAADDKDYCGKDAASCPFGDFEVPLPALPGEEEGSSKNICCLVDTLKGDGSDEVAPIRGFVARLANYIIAAIVAIALIMIVVAGYVYMTAGGAADRVQIAKKILAGAILGMILALLTFVILNTINSAILTG